MKAYAGLVRILILVLLLAALLGAVIFWLSLPRVIVVSPANAAADVPAAAPLVLQFSRPMQPDTVETRLQIQPAVTGQYTWQENALTFTPDDPWPAGETVQVQLQAGARSQGFLSLPVQAGLDWSFTVRQPRLLFLFPADGPANLYLRDPLSGANQALTALPAGVLDFSVAPDGRRIVFSAQSPQGGTDLYLLDLSAVAGRPDTAASQAQPQPTAAPSDTETPPGIPEPRRLIACSPGACRLPVVSPDGTLLAFERTDPPAPGQAIKPNIWIAPLAQPQDAAPVSDPTRSALLPAWSPAGELSFYDQDSQVFVVVQPDGTEQARFQNETGEPGSWQPDGQGFVAPEIGFMDANVSSSLQNLERLANSHLMLYPLPPAAPIDLSQEETLEDSVPVFSPDGSQLVFARKYLDTRRWTPGRQMWLMDMNAPREARPLTDNPEYNHFDFSWSPDGRRLAYVRFNQSLLTEAPEIWIMDVQTGEPAQQITGGFSPRWIP